MGDGHRLKSPKEIQGEWAQASGEYAAALRWVLMLLTTHSLC
jgi:hypothetical protein